jgi:hypothetical protein
MSVALILADALGLLSSPIPGPLSAACAMTAQSRSPAAAIRPQLPQTGHGQR